MPPVGSMASPHGWFKAAALAKPPSPAKATLPLPAMVAMMPCDCAREALKSTHMTEAPIMVGFKPINSPAFAPPIMLWLQACQLPLLFLNGFMPIRLPTLDQKSEFRQAPAL